MVMPSSIESSARRLQTTTFQVVVFYGINTQISSDTSQVTINAAATNTANLVGTLSSIQLYSMPT